MKNHMLSLLMIAAVMISRYDAKQAPDISGTLKGFQGLFVDCLNRVHGKIQPPRGSWQCPNGCKNIRGIVVKYDELLGKRAGE
jgi:hypothetical protein